LYSLLLDDSFALENLEGKLGYYIGSFDPIHLGHQSFCESLINEGYVDYILIYAVPDGDDFKNRSDLKLRQQMLLSLFENHSRILVTCWNPVELQNHFKKTLEKLQIIGMIGSDIIIERFLSPNAALSKEYHDIYMRGIPLPEKHYYDTIGARMSLKAEYFFVALRGDDDLSFLNGKLGDREFKAFPVEPAYKYLSSSKVRSAIQLKKSFDGMLSQNIQAIIKNENMYGFTSHLDVNILKSFLTMKEKDPKVKSPSKPTN
jgi:nicotinic acid mononucleotide adenylyltransferase